MTSEGITQLTRRQGWDSHLLLPLPQDSHRGQNLSRQSTAPRTLGSKTPCPPSEKTQTNASTSEGGGCALQGLPKTTPETGCRSGYLPRPAPHAPSSSLVKGRKVVSSFRFLLKSMHRRLSFFLMPLIF